MEQLGELERSQLIGRFGRSYGAGETIFNDGDRAEGCFLVHEGRVRLIKRVRSTERSLALLRPGDLFGEDALLPNSARRSTAIALSDLRVLVLDRETFGVLIAGHAEVASRLVEQLVRRLQDAEEQLENAMLADSPSRVVNTLLRMASSTLPSEEGHLLSTSPLELASRVGLDVEVVRKVIHQLHDNGYLRMAEDEIAIPRLEDLRRLYQLMGVKEEVRSGFP